MFTIICLIEAPGGIARSNLIPWSKSWGSDSELSKAGVGLKIGQIIKKNWHILVNHYKPCGSPLLRGRL